MAKIPHCRTCGGTQIRRDAYAEYDPEKGEWVLLTIFDNAYCEDCGEERSYTMREPKNEQG